MPMKGSGPTSLREIDRFEGGVGWLAYPDERMQRASHALATDGEVWLVDPVDARGLDDLLSDLGTVRGVVLLLDRHRRDAATIARRHGVAVHRPSWMSNVDAELEVPIDDVETSLDGTGFRVHKLVDWPVWREAYLYDETDGTLVVADALGTAPYFCTSDERIGVHPMLRPLPPTELADLDVERVLVGHGEGVHEDATRAVRDAVTNGRRRTPALYARTVREFVFG
ncbi:hypothetical protein ACFQPA_05040 [Halomarina halobia]|uniref:MBL fold metallo-hydrolase n=1 Tax=Halomarina halobia TaxID=3033386 RepID=A0ABD6A6G9_9EURY|nr:hypothetical protein [Halomarina sp. PSR21]